MLTIWIVLKGETHFLRGGGAAAVHHGDLKRGLLLQALTILPDIHICDTKSKSEYVQTADQHTHAHGKLLLH